MNPLRFLANRISPRNSSPKPSCFAIVGTPEEVAMVNRFLGREINQRERTHNRGKSEDFIQFTVPLTRDTSQEKSVWAFGPTYRAFEELSTKSYTVDSDTGKWQLIPESPDKIKDYQRFLENPPIDLTIEARSLMQAVPLDSRPFWASVKATASRLLKKCTANQ